MKKALIFFGILAGLLSSCTDPVSNPIQSDPQGDQPGNDSQVAASYTLSLKGIDISQAAYLALVGEKNGGAKMHGAYAPRADQGGHKVLYSIDEEGNMSVVVCVFEVQTDSDGVVTTTEIESEIQLTVGNVFTIGTDYLWFANCSYRCDSIDNLPEGLADCIRQMIARTESSPRGDNFLIRKQDGKIYDMQDVIEYFPNIQNNQLRIGNEVIDNPNGELLEAYGIVAQLDRCIYLANGTFNGGVYRIDDNDNHLTIRTIVNNTGSLPVYAAYALPTTKGYVGTMLSYERNEKIPALIMPDGTYPAVTGLEQPSLGGNFADNHYNGDITSMIRIDDELFIHAPYDAMEYTDDYSMNKFGTAMYKVTVENGRPKARLCDRLYAYIKPITGRRVFNTTFNSLGYYYVWDPTEPTGTCQRPIGSIITFDPNTEKFNIETLGAGFPSDEKAYDADGNAYVANAGRDLCSFVIYNLPNRTSELVNVDRSAVPTYNYNYGYKFNAQLKQYSEVIMLADGTSRVILTDCTGAHRGISRVQQTDENTQTDMEDITIIPLSPQDSSHDDSPTGQGGGMPDLNSFRLTGETSGSLTKGHLHDTKQMK